jgi:hypothetical protein
MTRLIASLAPDLATQQAMRGAHVDSSTAMLEIWF